MSKKKSPRALELPLFDLPLHANDEERDTAEELEPLEETADPLLHSEGAAAAPDPGSGASSGAEAAPAEEEEIPAPVRDRLLSGLLDLGIQLLVLGGAAAAVHAMGLELGPADAGPFGILALIFSFLYWFIPLAFWGQTPGMAWVGNSAVSLTDEPLTFGQSVLRWLGAVLTLAFLGLPIALAFGGRSLTDRLSESKTVVL